MKKYRKPRIEKGASAIYSLSVGLETWTKYFTKYTMNEDLPQIQLAARLIHAYCFDNLFKGWA